MLITFIFLVGDKLSCIYMKYTPIADTNQRELLRKMYLDGYSLMQLSLNFNEAYGTVRDTLLDMNVVLRKTKLPNQVHKFVLPASTHKYAHLIEEPRCEGKSYSELLKERGLKVYSSWGK